MAEYVEREALEKKLNVRLAYLLDKNGPYDHFTDGYDEAVSTVEEFPVADVVPVVHGRWEHGYYCYEPATQCSVCKVCLAKGHRAEKQFTYCPNCGAKMDGGADHE